MGVINQISAGIIVSLWQLAFKRVEVDEQEKDSEVILNMKKGVFSQIGKAESVLYKVPSREFPQVRLGF